MDINDLRDQLAHYAQELDRRRESGILANVVTAFYEARRQLQRLTPQWHEMPTVAEVKARDMKRWLRKSPKYGVDIVTLTFKEDEALLYFHEFDSTTPAGSHDAECEWWPCDSDGIREPSWVTT